MVARPADLPALAALVQEYGTLFNVAQRKSQGELTGRGIAFITELNGEPCVVRHYRRGGSVASVLNDRYLRAARNRVLHELRISEAARGRGVTTPSVKCGAWYTHGIFRRFDIATSYIPDSSDLAALIFDPARAHAAASLAAALLRDLLRAGLIHRDLNLKNILIAPGHAYVLDLDRCELVERILPTQAAAMRARFFRSLDKWARVAGRSAPPDAVATLHEGFRV